MTCALAVAAVAYIYSKQQAKSYSASAVLLFRNTGYDQIVFGASTVSPNDDPTRDAATDLDLVTLRTVADKTAAALGGGLTGAKVANQVTAASNGQSNTLVVTAHNANPRLAATLATTYAQQFIATRRQGDQAVLFHALGVVRQELARAPRGNTSEVQSLRNRANQLELLASLQTGNAELVQRAVVPNAPTSPQPKRDALIGAFLGILLGLGVIALRSRFDQRFDTADAVEEWFERPVIGRVPESPAYQEGQTSPLDPLPSLEREVFVLMQTQLRYFNIGAKIQTLLVTSANSGDGKTTIARHLAAAAALSGSNVLLVEADLRRPTLAASFAPGWRVGLSDVLVGSTSLEDAIVTYEAEPTMPLKHQLAVLYAGRQPPNPAELIDSDAMRELLRDLRNRYDLVVIDTPPISQIADAIPLATEVDGVIGVVRLGRTTRESAKDMRRQLDRLEVRILGVAVNSADLPTAGYGYYQQPAPTEQLEETSQAS